MRSITIQRRKTFVGCLMKVKVYIEDPTNPELTISGKPCRLLGKIKNGETVTFPIPETASTIFVIGDKASRNYSSEMLPIAEGSHDIFVSGKITYNTIQGNPFRFDGITGEETEAHRQKSRKKGIAVYVTTFILCFAIGFLFAFAERLFPQEPQTFTGDGFAITLTDAFESYDDADYVGDFESYYAAVLVERLRPSDVGGASLTELAEGISKEDSDTFRVLKNVTKEGELLYYEYENIEYETSYAAYFFADGGYYYVFTFGFDSEDFEEYRQSFTEWVSSITFQ